PHMVMGTRRYQRWFAGEQACAPTVHTLPIPGTCGDARKRRVARSEGIPAMPAVGVGRSLAGTQYVGPLVAETFRGTLCGGRSSDGNGSTKDTTAEENGPYASGGVRRRRGRRSVQPRSVPEGGQHASAAEARAGDRAGPARAA